MAIVRIAALMFYCVAISAAATEGKAIPGQEQAEVVTVGVFAMAPFVLAGRERTSGVLIDFFDKEIAPRMGVRFQWERPMTATRLEHSLVRGRVMFTPILLRTRQRERAGIRFAGDPHIFFEPCLAVLPDSPLTSVTSPADLAGIRVGWVQGGVLPGFLQDRRVRFDRVGSVEWTSANLEKLRIRRIGAAYFTNRYTPWYVAVQKGMRIRLIKLPTKGMGLHGAFAPSTPASLAERYERAADEAFADGRFDAYLDRAIEAQAAALEHDP